jgi:hypothetical protein
MPKLLCPCGYVHDLSPIPDEGWITVKDGDYEALTAAEVLATIDSAAAGKQGEPETSFARLTGSLYECSRCGRIMWKRPGDSEFRSFKLETPVSAG